MSNLSIGMSQHRIQTPLTRTQTGTGITPPKTQTTPPSVLDASAYRQLYGGKSPITDGNSGLSDSQVATMGKLIDNSPPELVRKRSGQIPKPSLSLTQSTGSVPQQDVTVTTTPPTIVTTPPTTTTTVPPSTTTPQPFKQSDLKFKDKDLVLARFAYTQAENQLKRNTPKLVRDSLQGDIQTLSKELSKADKGIGGISQKDKDAILARAKQQAYDIVAATGKRDELGLAFGRMKDDELKQLVTSLVIDARDDKAQNFDQLSTKKQEFVNAIVDGIKAGKKDANRPEFTKPPCMMVLAEQGIGPAIHKMLEHSGLSKGQLASIQVMTGTEKAALLKPFLGAGNNQLKSLAVAALGTYHPPLQARTTQPYVTDIGPDDLGAGVKQALSSLSTNPDGVHKAGVQQALSAHIDSLGKDHNTVWQLSIMSDTQIKALLQKAAGGNGSTTPIAPPLDDELVQDIRKMLPNQASDNTVKLDKFDVPATMKIGDKTYTAQSHIYTSGFGATFSYVNLADPTGQDKVAVKILMPKDDMTPEKLHADTVAELNLHRELQGPNGHGNVIGLKGAVPGPNQSMCIVMEHAGGGGLDKLAEQIHAELKANRLSKEAAQLMGLAILKQSLESVQYMHEDRQMLHSDLKTANMMLGSDGQVKMIDFGTSHVGPERFIDQRIVAQPRFLAPEQATVDQKGAGSVATTKSDMWSVGTMAYSLLVGDQEAHPFFHKNNMTIDIELAIVGHMNNPQSRIMDQAPGWQSTPSSKPIEDLVNGLMMPTPEQRLSARDALQSPLLQDPRLSSDAMKQIMKNLSVPTVPGLSKEEEGEQRFNTVRLALETLASS